MATINHGELQMSTLPAKSSKKRVIQYAPPNQLPVTHRVLSLGAGVQSSTLFYMCLDGLFEQAPDYFVFADTGWEPAAVYEHLEYLKGLAQEHGKEIHIVSGGDLRQQTLDRINHGARFASIPAHVRNKEGQAAILRRQCTKDFKIVPIDQFVRRTVLGVEKGRRVPKTVHVERWIGISLDEIWRAKDSRDRWATHRHPLIEMRMRRDDCIQWIIERGRRMPPKSACIGCPYHDNAYWRMLKQDAPEEFEDAAQFDDAIRTGLRGVDCNTYLHRSLVPLRMVDFSTPEERGQQVLGFKEANLFLQECEGMCGV